MQTRFIAPTPSEEDPRAVPREGMVHVKAKEAIELLRRNRMSLAVSDEHPIGVREVVQILAIADLADRRSIDDLRVPPGRSFGLPEGGGRRQLVKLTDRVEPSGKQGVGLRL